MKYTFVGDIHGKVEAVERALAKDGKKIFVGDFMDSFDRPWPDHARCVNLVLEAIAQGDTQVIYGNHELSYLMPRHRCSGWTQKNAEIMVQFEDQIRQAFKPHILLSPQLLVTHAGLTNQLWVQHKITLDNLDQQLTDWWPRHSSPLHFIGNYRGGMNSVGGTFWCDFNAEFVPVKGLTQVFGHTAGHGIRRKEDSFCIDCLDHCHDFLEMEI